MEAPEVKLELDGEEGEQIYGVAPHADDVEGKASIEAGIGEDWADRGPLAARLRRRALYHLRVGPTTVLPLLLVLHDPLQIEAFKTPHAENDGEVVDDVECKRSSGEGSAQFLRALTMALRDVLMAYLVSSTTNGRVWLSVPSVSSTSSSSSSGGRRFFSMPGRSDVRFTYRFAPTTPRYAVMTKSSPSSGHKRRSLSSSSTSSTHHGDDDREHRAQKKPRQDDAGEEEEKAEMNELEERNEAKEDDGESSVGAMSGSEEQDRLASDGEEEEEDDEEEEEEGQDGDEEDDEEGLSEDELLERRRKKQMKQLADSYRGYSVTPHTLVVETLSAAQAATMDDILEHAAATKSLPPAHKLSHYFGGGNGNGGGSSGSATKTTARGGGKRRAPAGRKSAGTATSKTKTNSRPKKRLSN